MGAIVKLIVAAMTPVIATVIVIVMITVPVAVIVVEVEAKDKLNGINASLQSHLEWSRRSDVDLLLKCRMAQHQHEDVSTLNN